MLGRVWRDLHEIVLVDLDLPLAGGFTLLLRLKENRFCQDIPVLVTSVKYAQESEEVQLCSRDLGARDFLGRLFSMLEVPSLLRHLAEASREDEDTVAA